MKFVTVNDLTLHYATFGNGTQLVFVNSLGSDLRIWDDVVPLLADRFRTVRYDKRGHGLSDCPTAPYSMDDHVADLVGLLDTLEVETAVFIGISVGGMIAQAFTLAYPDRVRGLVLCDTAAKLGTAVYWNDRINAIQENGMATLAGPILSRWFAPDFAERCPEVYRGCYNMLASNRTEGYIGTCITLRDTDLRDQITQIAVPVLVLCGAEDSATPPDLVLELANGLENGRFSIIHNAGHTPSVEQPKQLAEQIEQFLQEIGR